MKALLTRLPDKKTNLKLYATAVFIVYSWTMFASFWKVPSWLFFLRISDILSIYAYSFVTNFAESIVLFLVAFVLGCLFSRFLKGSGLLPLSVTIMLFGMGSLLLRLSLFRDPNVREGFVHGHFLWWSVTFLLLIVLAWMVSRFKWLQTGLENIADRLTVFLYIYLPLTAVSIIIVILRIG